MNGCDKKEYDDADIISKRITASHPILHQPSPPTAQQTCMKHHLMPYTETQVINHHAIQQSNPLVNTSSENLQLYWRVAYIISITEGGPIKPGTDALVFGSRSGPRAKTI